MPAKIEFSVDKCKNSFHMTKLPNNLGRFPILLHELQVQKTEEKLEVVLFPLTLEIDHAEKSAIIGVVYSLTFYFSLVLILIPTLINYFYLLGLLESDAILHSYLNNGPSASSKHSVNNVFHFFFCGWLLIYIFSISSTIFNKYGWINHHNAKVEYNKANSQAKGEMRNPVAN
ncbi:hypothetical protein AGLY_009227 [Aphis glycines]|uniref:Uncharacterized protein n=1 Tax=Aphis glycines TaxID=307491 RepID=A0A6G0TIN5_APHGL|nr:hypothetical protein AGLY_009227 [Aphis glycines]